MSAGPILNNGTQSPAEKSNGWRPKKRNIFFIKVWKKISAETTRNEEKEIYKYILGKEIYEKAREKEREVLGTFLWILTCSYNTTIDFLYIVPYYSQQIWKTFSYGSFKFRKRMKITVFIKNKISCIHSFISSFSCFLFWFKLISSIMLSENLIG